MMDYFRDIYDRYFGYEYHRCVEEDYNFSSKLINDSRTYRIFLNISHYFNIISIQPMKLSEIYHILTLQFHNPFSRKGIVQKSRIYLLYIIIFAELLLAGSVGFGLLMFEALIKHWNPRVIRGANRTEFCAFEDDIFHNDNVYKDSKHIHDTIEFLGVGITAAIDVTAFFICGVALTVLSLVVYGVFNIGRIYQLRTLTFCSSPLMVRSMFRDKLEEISNFVFQNEDPIEPIIKNNSFDSNRINSLIMNGNHQEFGRVSNDCDCKPSENLRRQRFARFVRCERIIDLVNPECLSMRTYEKALHTRDLALISCVIIDLMAIFMFTMVIAWFEGMARVDQRFNQLQCQAWHPNATMIREDLFLPPLDESEYEAYATNDRSTLTYLKLALFIELNKMLSVRSCILITIHIFSISCYIIWLTIYIMLFLLELLSNSSWLCQIELQLDACRTLLEICYTTKNKLETTKTGDKIHEHEWRFQYRSIEKALTVTYLNFELFQLEYPVYQDIANLIALHSVTVSGIVILLSVVIQMNSIAKFSILIWTMNVSAIILVNVLTLSCSRITTKLISVSKQITDLISVASENSMELDQIVKIWRKQMIREHEWISLYSVRVFGVPLSRQNMLTLNTTVIGLWLFLNRSIFH